MRLGVVLTGRTSQRKGRAGELELARLLQEYGYNVEPGRAVSYGSTPDITGLPGVHIECKRAEQLRPYDWNRRSGTLCALVTASPPCSSAAPGPRGWW